MARRLLAIVLCLSLLGLADRGAAALTTRVLLPLADTSGGLGGGGSTAEWSQFGHDPQRSGYAGEGVATPWRLRWQWNGADASGKPQSSHLTVPDLVQPITGGGRVYMVAANSVYALDAATGAVLWSNGALGPLSATPAYAGGSLYVASGSGALHRLDAASGTVLGSFQAAGALSLAPAVVGSTLYVVAAGGTLYA